MSKSNKPGSGAELNTTPLNTPIPPQAQPSAPVESVYGASELAEAARKHFGVPPEVVQVALKLAGKDKATPSEAKQIVKEFMERKVRK